MTKLYFGECIVRRKNYKAKQGINENTRIVVPSKEYRRSCHEERHMRDFCGDSHVVIFDMGGGYISIPFSIIVYFCVSYIYMYVCYILTVKTLKGS